MDKKELESLNNKLRGVFHYSFNYEICKSEENLKKKARSLILGFFYRIIYTNLTKKEFNFYDYYNSELEEILKMNLCNLIDDVIIDLKHYLKYVKKYKDEDSIFYELERINDDYLDIHKIPEFNSKKYIREKVEHIGDIVSILGNKLNISVPSKMTVRFGEEDYSRYENEIICKGGNFLDDNYDLDSFWEYITPCATDDAILNKFELKLYLKKVEDVRIEILNSLIVLENFLELNFIHMFFTDEEINKIKDFYNFFENFNEEHAELFGHDELKYGEQWNSRW